MLENFAKLFTVQELHTVFDKAYFYMVWLLIWTSYFLLVNTGFRPENRRKQLSKKMADDIRNRLVSITHGLFSFAMTAYHIIAHSPQYNQPLTNFQSLLIMISMSYFTYDLLACMFYGLTDFGLYLHHGLVIFGYAVDEYMGYGGTETLSTLSLCSLLFLTNIINKVGLFLAEISNCPMHMRKILRSLGMRYTKSHEILEYLYFCKKASGSLGSFGFI